MSIDLSLDRIRRLLAVLPPYTRPTIHVAGTNGKGSVCALASSILSASSPPLVVGRFNSPHLVSILDCISIENRPVSAEAYASAREQVERTDRENGVGASNFELLACTALLAFERAAVDVVVLEVGMGGRLDATNAVPDEYILVSALTAVDLDHQAFLGDTVEAITREKAAIARPGKPFVIGLQVHPQVDHVARSVVQAAGGVVCSRAAVWPASGSPNHSLGGSSLKSAGAGLEMASTPEPRPVQIMMPCFTDPVFAELPLHGAHQLANLEVAAGIVSVLLTHPACQRPELKLQDRITPVTVARGIRNTRWPGRLSYHTLQLPSESPTDSAGSRRVLVLADGAHNPASATALADYLSDVLAQRASPDRPFTLTYVLGLSHSPPKTPVQTLAPLFALGARFPVRLGAALLRFTPPEGMPWVRAEPPSELRAAVASFVPRLSPSSGLAFLPGSEDTGADMEDPAQALERALRWAAGRSGGRGGEGSQEDGGDALVVLAGSLYLVADFYRLLARLGQGAEIWGAN
ncbi:Mur ligase [Trametes elegans]|nr:Mur ligase [Trametes elegans]